MIFHYNTTVNSDGTYVLPKGFDRRWFEQIKPNAIKSTPPGDSLAVVCCGPPVLVDDVRNTVSQKLLGYPERIIEYFEEYQCW